MAQSLSYVKGSTGEPLITATIGQALERAAEQWRNQQALVVRHQGVRLSYAELNERVDAFAAGLIALGLAARRSRRHLGAELLPNGS